MQDLVPKQLDEPLPEAVVNTRKDTVYLFPTHPPKKGIKRNIISHIQSHENIVCTMRTFIKLIEILFVGWHRDKTGAKSIVTIMALLWNMANIIKSERLSD